MCEPGKKDRYSPPVPLNLSYFGRGWNPNRGLIKYGQILSLVRREVFLRASGALSSQPRERATPVGEDPSEREEEEKAAERRPSAPAI